MIAIFVFLIFVVRTTEGSIYGTVQKKGSDAFANASRDMANL